MENKIIFFYFFIHSIGTHQNLTAFNPSSFSEPSWGRWASDCSGGDQRGPQPPTKRDNSYRLGFFCHRCSSHKLLIEQGRHVNIERMLRLCQNCNSNVIEDEYHFLLACPAYRHLRIKYLKKYYYTWPSINKFKLLLSTQSKNIIQNIAKYLDEAFKIRK